MGEDGIGSRELHRYLWDGSCFSPSTHVEKIGSKPGRGSTGRVQVNIGDDQGRGEVSTLDTSGRAGCR